MKTYTINLLIAEDGPVWKAPVLVRLEASGRTAEQLGTLLAECQVTVNDLKLNDSDTTTKVTSESPDELDIKPFYPGFK